MHQIIRTLISTGLLSLPITSYAQTITLTYQGAPMSGTSEQIVSYPGIPPTYTPITGAFTGSITLDGTVSGDDLGLVSYSFSGPINSYGGAPNIAPVFGTTSWLLGPGGISLVTSNGQLTGATFNASGSIGDLGSYGSNIGSGGDSDMYYFYNPGSAITTLAAAGSNVAGTWTVSPSEAPEIDPASTVGGLTLLLGGLAVARGRRLHPCNQSDLGLTQ